MAWGGASRRWQPFEFAQTDTVAASLVAPVTQVLVGLLVRTRGGYIVASDCDVAAETDGSGIWRPVVWPVSSATGEVNNADGFAYHATGGQPGYA